MLFISVNLHDLYGSVWFLSNYDSRKDKTYYWLDFSQCQSSRVVEMHSKSLRDTVCLVCVDNIVRGNVYLHYEHCSTKDCS